MKEQMQQTFSRYGCTVSVIHGGQTTETKALIQPLTAMRPEEPITVTPLGAADERCLRYLGPAAVCVEMGDSVTFDGVRYVVRNAAAVYVGNEIAYYWAILHPEEAAV